jgi:hypothetical protein
MLPERRLSNDIVPDHLEFLNILYVHEIHQFPIWKPRRIVLKKRYDVNMSSIFICPISVFHRNMNGTDESFIYLVKFQQHPSFFIIVREAPIYYP